MKSLIIIISLEIHISTSFSQPSRGAWNMIARYPNHQISGTEEQHEIKNYKTSSVVIVTNKVMVG